VFEFEGEEALEDERGGPGTGHAPSTRAPRGSTRRWRRDQTQEAPDSSNPSRSQGEPAGDRFLVEATLSPGEYTVRLVARAPDLEVTRRAPTPSVCPLPFPLACR
jgi:hypothetical protein